MMKFRSPILFAIACIFLLHYCKRNGSPSAENANSVFDESANIPADFMDFYMKFHQDSIYQMNHIQFPLKGMPAMAIDLSQDSLNNFYWAKEEWKLHKTFMGKEEEYLKEYRKISNELISEFIIERQMGYGMERRFSKFSGKWYLIYYMDMNKME